MKRTNTCTNGSNKKTKRVFSYDDDKDNVITCQSCDWEGTLRNLDWDSFDDNGCIYECPKCWSYIATVLHPTQDKVNNLGLEEDKTKFGTHQEFLDSVNKSQLKSIDQLPEIHNDPLIITWDCDEEFIYIKHGDIVLWTEVATYQHYERFIEVGQLLKEKYRHRLKDIVPTPRSSIYLYGDRLSSPDYVNRFRKELTDQYQQYQQYKLDEFDYVNAHELARRITYLSNAFPNCHLQFPILSWCYIGELSDLENELRKANLEYEVFKGIFYDSYAEGDYDLCIMTNSKCNTTLKLSTAFYESLKNGLTINCQTPDYYNGEYYPIFPFINVEVPNYSFEEFKEVMDNVFIERGKIIVKYNTHKTEF